MPGRALCSGDARLKIFNAESVWSLMGFDWNDIFAELLWGVNILTASCCMVYLLLVLYTSETAGDKGIIKTAVAYLFLFIITFTGAVTYRGNPALYVAIAPGILFALTTLPVLLYKMVCGLTDTEGKSRFSNWHFALPVIATAIWTIVILTIPFEVRVNIIRDFGKPAEGYVELSGYFISISLHQVVFGLMYMPLSFVRLLAYRKSISGKNSSDSHYRLRWMETVILISIIITLIAVIMLFTGNRNFYFIRISALLPCVLYVFSLFILTLNILRRNYPPRKTEGNNKSRLTLLPGRDAMPPEQRTRRENKPEKEAIRKMAGTEKEIIQNPVSVHITKTNKKEFEAFFRSEKPYLDPGLTLVGLAQTLGTNRVVLSGFINKAYGVNFNTFVNGWRLQEVERLRKYKKYQSQPLAEVIKLAGFGSYDSYRRAKEANAGIPDSIGKEVRNGQ